MRYLHLENKKMLFGRNIELLFLVSSIIVKISTFGLVCICQNFLYNCTIQEQFKAFLLQCVGSWYECGQSTLVFYWQQNRLLSFSSVPEEINVTRTLDDIRNEATGNIHGGASLHSQYFSRRRKIVLKCLESGHLSTTVSIWGSFGILTSPGLTPWTVSVIFCFVHLDGQLYLAGHRPSQPLIDLWNQMFFK